MKRIYIFIALCVNLTIHSCAVRCLYQRESLEGVYYDIANQDNYNVLFLNSDSTFILNSVSSCFGKHTEIGKWQYLNNYLYLGHPTTQVIRRENSDSTTNICVLFQIDYSSEFMDKAIKHNQNYYIPVQEIPIRIYNNNCCEIYYPDEKGYVQLPLEYDADYIVIENNEYIFVKGLDTHIYTIFFERPGRLYRKKGNILQGVSNKNNKLYKKPPNKRSKRVYCI